MDKYFLIQKLSTTKERRSFLLLSCFNVYAVMIINDSMKSDKNTKILKKKKIQLRKNNTSLMEKNKCLKKC